MNTKEPKHCYKCMYYRTKESFKDADREELPLTMFLRDGSSDKYIYLDKLPPGRALCYSSTMDAIITKNLNKYFNTIISPSTIVTCIVNDVKKFER